MTNELQCSICNRQDHRGIIIKDEYICRGCEEEIVNTSPANEDYEEYKDKIKEILFK